MDHLTQHLARSLPEDGLAGTLVGRAWVPGEGPCVVALRAEGAFDLTDEAWTMSELLNRPDAVALARAGGRRLAGVEELLAGTGAEDRPGLLAPCDLQAIRGCGVVFIRSMLERVVEERAAGDASRAEELRARFAARIGADLADIRPGSAEAASLKATLIEDGLWSQYLEVAIGPDAEIFTKAQPMSAVGTGVEIGLRPDSAWNNSEPEAVLVVDAGGRIVGATLGNDVNLRDFEGRSALLLGKSKDNNGSCAIGPFIRLFDDSFSLDDLRRAELRYSVEGADGFSLAERGSLGAIARDFTELVSQAFVCHQYPDGLMLFTGTMFAPTQDRGGAGSGFTHQVGDVVSIGTPKLGVLVNRVGLSDAIPPWQFGTGALLRSLARRRMRLNA